MNAPVTIADLATLDEERASFAWTKPTWSGSLPWSCFLGKRADVFGQGNTPEEAFANAIAKRDDVDARRTARVTELRAELARLESKA